MQKIHLDKERLRELRHNCEIDRSFLEQLGIRIASETAKEIKFHSPFSSDTKASAHIDLKDGRWYCFSTRQGGGPIELVAKIKNIDCYAAGRFLLDTGLSFLASEGGEILADTRNKAQTALVTKNEEPPRSEGGKKEEQCNKPIRQNLVPLLDMNHSMANERGISPETCKYLGCGFLSEEKTSPKNKMKNRFVFQLRGIQSNSKGQSESSILTHIGRSAIKDEEDAKWLFYGGFQKSLEIFNIDKVLLDVGAREQINATKQLVIVEGAFDLAKCVEAGIKNVVSPLGAWLDPMQSIKLKQIIDKTEAESVIVFFDRDDAGARGSQQVIEELGKLEIEAQAFDWERSFSSHARGERRIPKEIKDPCEFHVEHLSWLRKKGLI